MAEVVLSIVATIAVGYGIHRLQQRRRRIGIDVTVENRSADRSDGTIYENSAGSRQVNISILVKNRDKLPITVNSFIVAVPQYPAHLPVVRRLVRSWPQRQNVSLPIRGCKLPTVVGPGETLGEIYLHGLEVASLLDQRGIHPLSCVVFCALDSRGNVYPSRPVEVDLDDWRDDRGSWLIAFA
ncbi:MAG: hypothetical protein KJO98_04800 [Rhodothermia bacterium]|nr:hypothetical protein [Rhodothermia bacterium]